MLKYTHGQPLHREGVYLDGVMQDRLDDVQRVTTPTLAVRMNGPG